MNLSWTDSSWKEYLYWQGHDKKAEIYFTFWQG